MPRSSLPSMRRCVATIEVAIIEVVQGLNIFHFLQDDEVEVAFQDGLAFAAQGRVILGRGGSDLLELAGVGWVGLMLADAVEEVEHVVGADLELLDRRQRPLLDRRGLGGDRRLGQGR